MAEVPDLHPDAMNIILVGQIGLRIEFVMSLRGLLGRSHMCLFCECCSEASRKAETYIPRNRASMPETPKS